MKPAMATLFAESEAFNSANRDNTRKVQIRNQAKVPQWARKNYANARTASHERREHDENSTASPGSVPRT